MENAEEAQPEYIVIDDEDSASSTGAFVRGGVKKEEEKEEETTLSYKIASLHHRTTLLQQDLHLATQDARAAEIIAAGEKVQQLVDRLAAEDDRKMFAEGQKRKLAEATTQLDDARREIQAGAEREREMNERLTAAIKKLEGARAEAVIAINNKAKLTEKNGALMKELEELKGANRPLALEASNSELQQKVQHLGSELSRVVEERNSDRSRIEELERQLQAYRVAQQQQPSQTPPHTPGSSQQHPQTPHQQQMPQLTPNYSFFTPPGMACEQIPHPSNILQMCIRDGQGTIPYNHAVEKMRARFPAVLDWCLRKCPIIENEIHRCEACDKNLKKFHIISHFFSKDHAKMVRRCNGAVSFAAFEHWQGKLNEARALQQAGLNAADAAATQEDAAMEVEDDKN